MVGDGVCAAPSVELEQDGIDAVRRSTRRYAHLAGDLFRRHALGDTQKRFQLAWCQAPPKMAHPRAGSDRFHDLSRLGVFQGFAQLKDKRGRKGEGFAVFVDRVE